MILDGFIKKSLPYGCFVEFMSNLVALAPNKVCCYEVTMGSCDFYFYSILKMSTFLMAAVCTVKGKVYEQR